MPAIEENYDVVVVGAGHAGCEAALACARLGLETIIFTVSVDSIAMMPCNPNIGGSSKGHLVREIDALGGQMGINIDKTFIQSKMLNKSKGPAVHSLRAQADKVNYSMEMRKTLQNTEHLTIRQAEVAEIITVPANSADGETAAVEKKDGQMVEINGELQKITGVKTVSGGVYHCKAVVLCTGTYLRARCLTGEMITYTGPNGLMAANHLTDSLKAHGIEMFRFKTGTPARVDKRSLDFSKMQEQKGDERVVPFSFTTNPEDVQIDQVSCWLTYTNPKTHEISSIPLRLLKWNCPGSVCVCAAQRELISVHYVRTSVRNFPVEHVWNPCCAQRYLNFVHRMRFASPRSKNVYKKRQDRHRQNSGTQRCLILFMRLIPYFYSIKKR